MSIYVFKIHFNIFQYLVFVLKYFLTEYLNTFEVFSAHLCIGVYEYVLIVEKNNVLNIKYFLKVQQAPLFQANISYQRVKSIKNSSNIYNCNSNIEMKFILLIASYFQTIEKYYNLCFHFGRPQVTIAKFCESDNSSRLSERVSTQRHVYLSFFLDVRSRKRNHEIKCCVLFCSEYSWRYGAFFWARNSGNS